VNPDEINVGEIVAEMDELGKAKFNEALAAARLKKALAHIAQLQQGAAQLEQNGARSGD
jgi:hypothetical protein